MPQGFPFLRILPHLWVPFGQDAALTLHTPLLKSGHSMVPSFKDVAVPTCLAAGGGGGGALLCFFLPEPLSLPLPPSRLL